MGNSKRQRVPGNQPDRRAIGFHRVRERELFGRNEALGVLIALERVSYRFKIHVFGLSFNHKHDLVSVEVAWAGADCEGNLDDFFELCFNLFNLELDCARIDDVVEPSADGKGAVRVDARDIVRDERARRDGGRMNDERALGRKRNRHSGKRPVAGFPFGPVQAPKRNVGKRLRHAVGRIDAAPDGLELPEKKVVDCAAADENVPGIRKHFRRLRIREDRGRLHGRDGDEIDGVRDGLEGIPRGRHRNEIKAALDGAYDHHLTCDVAHRHGKKVRVAGLQSKIADRHAGARAHARLLGLKCLGRSGRA